jgi:hypothetical protein
MSLVTILRQDLLYGIGGPLNRACFDYGSTKTRSSEEEKVDTKLRDVKKFVEWHLSGNVALKDQTIQELFDLALMNAVQKSAIDCLDMYQDCSPQASEAANKAYIDALSGEEDDFIVIQNCKSIQEQTIDLFTAWRDNPSLVFSPPLQDDLTKQRIDYLRNKLLPQIKLRIADV